MTAPAAPPSSPLDLIRVVLVEPLYGGNVGAVCRAMANMGLRDLALVAPRELYMEEAVRLACHGLPVLEARREFATPAEAVADCGLVMGTTARPGLYRQHARTPREWAGRALAAAGSGSRVALLFGREDRGLTNEELALCTQIVQIPSDARCPSLNLSHAVLVLAYELFVAAGVWTPPDEKSPEAPSRLRERLFAMWRETLLEIGFMTPDKADHMMLGLRRIFGRGLLTEDDVHILMGMARQAQWAARTGRPATPADGDAGADSGVTLPPRG